MIKTELQLLSPFFSFQQTQHLLPNMLTERNVELALEDACVIDDIILLLVQC